MIDVKKLQPTAGYVFVLEEEVEQKTASGIMLPDISKDRQPRGEVIAVGGTTPEGREAPCKKGDRVLFKKWQANELRVEKKLYLFLKYEDILATIK